MTQQSLGPTGHRKNCDSWGVYENRGESDTAAMCHGGWFDGEKFRECPSKFHCRQATRDGPQPRAAPAMNPSKPYGSRLLGSTRGSDPLYKFTRMAEERPLPRMPTSIPAKRGRSARPPNASQAVPYYAQARAQQNQYPSQGATYYPTPAEPPAEFPVEMRTPFVAPSGVATTSPSFLPVNGEGLAGRLTKNMAQGAMGAVAWHLFEFTRSVDMFRK